MATVSSAFEVTPLADGLPFGATVAGLRRAQLGDPDVCKALVDLWTDRGVILFRGESSQDMQVELSRCFGPLEPHPFPETRSGGHEELVTVRYRPEDGNWYEIDGKPIGGWLPWHSDLIYTDRINHGGILRPVQLPQSGGMTGFIDRIAAYERLPAALRDRIEGLHVVYAVDINMALHRFNRVGDIRLGRMAPPSMAIQGRKFTYPRAVHPMVYVQPETGRKVLNVSPTFALGIYEMGAGDGDALLEDVLAVCTDPAFAYHHDWREDDMVLWDNWRVLHSATGVPVDQTRIMERTTITGDYALGRLLDGRAEADFDV